MAVYVDYMHLTKLGQYRRMKMCHMVADTHEELLAMADRIGVQRKWIQGEGTPKEHFDICMSKRALAVMNGAREVSMDDVVMIVRGKRAHLEAHEADPCL